MFEWAIIRGAVMGGQPPALPGMSSGSMTPGRYERLIRGAALPQPTPASRAEVHPSLGLRDVEQTKRDVEAIPDLLDQAVPLRRGRLCCAVAALDHAVE